MLYHGTATKNVASILSQGLVGLHIWLARYEKDARTVGGLVVFAVNMDGLGSDDWDDQEKSDWQRCYHGGRIAPERLFLLHNLDSGATRAVAGESVI